MPSWCRECTSSGSRGTRTRDQESARVLWSRNDSTNQSVLLPCNALLLVRIGVGEALDLAGLATKQAVQVGADLVPAALFKSVALCAASLDRVSKDDDHAAAASVASFNQLGRTLNRLAPFLSSPEKYVSICFNPGASEETWQRASSHRIRERLTTKQSDKSDRCKGTSTLKSRGQCSEV